MGDRYAASSTVVVTDELRTVLAEWASEPRRRVTMAELVWAGTGTATTSTTSLVPDACDQTVWASACDDRDLRDCRLRRPELGA
jgi:hypothetical protein